MVWVVVRSNIMVDCPCYEWSDYHVARNTWTNPATLDENKQRGYQNLMRKHVGIVASNATHGHGRFRLPLASVIEQYTCHSYSGRNLAVPHALHNHMFLQRRMFEEIGLFQSPKPWTIRHPGASFC